jgi:two-component system, NarL family, nitrate/nitrite response regulator NarL
VGHQEIRLLIVSGNRLVRDVLGRLFKARTRVAVMIAEQFSLSSRPTFTPDVLLVDTAKPLIEGQNHIRVMRSDLPNLKIVLMSMDADESLFLEMIRRGVVGYLLRDACASDIAAAVRAVAEGAVVFPPQFSKTLLNYVARHPVSQDPMPAQLPMSLTRRERQLVPLVARGLTNKEIAAHFNLSEQTIKNHLHRICSKVGAEGRVKLLEVCGIPAAF